VHRGHPSRSRGEIAAGRFREDLYFGLNVIPFARPPLRERLEDVPRWSGLLPAPLRAGQQLPPQDLRAGGARLSPGLPWKGNVRELKNLVERLLILSPGDTITRQDLVTVGGGAQPGLSEALLSVQTLRDFQGAVGEALHPAEARGERLET
jgi:two-component system nitrogen regulation response regulator NtrX